MTFSNSVKITNFHETLLSLFLSYTVRSLFTQYKYLFYLKNKMQSHLIMACGTYDNNKKENKIEMKCIRKIKQTFLFTNINNQFTNRNQHSTEENRNNNKLKPTKLTIMKTGTTIK